MKTLFCLALAVTATAAYSADYPDSQVTRVVSYGDLDLARPAGMAILNARIRSAAGIVCRPRFDERAPEHASATRTCVNRAVARALDDVQSSGAHTTVAAIAPR